MYNSQVRTPTSLLKMESRLRALLLPQQHAQVGHGVHVVPLTASLGVQAASEGQCDGTAANYLLSNQLCRHGLPARVWSGWPLSSLAVQPGEDATSAKVSDLKLSNCANVSQQK
jgi:hypothetical protein